ncbi:MAG: hypothetical protein M3167_01360 [Acidobacteriota bacterium]|nr:hypothetical protein [Acidobacteriota bacterium]
MNGNRSSTYSRLFLVLGGLVVAGGVLRVVRAFMEIGGAVGTTESRPGASHALAWLASGRGRLVIGAAAVIAVIVVAVSVGVLRRRSWALGASVALLGVGAAAGLGVAAFQLAALVRGVDRTPEAAEIGFGPVLSYWRLCSVVVGFLVALFCGASLRRLRSEATRREFRG